MLRFIGLIVAMMFALSASVMSHAQEAASATHFPDAETFSRPFTLTDQLQMIEEAHAIGKNLLDRSELAPEEEARRPSGAIPVGCIPSNYNIEDVLAERRNGLTD